MPPLLHTHTTRTDYTAYIHNRPCASCGAKATTLLLVKHRLGGRRIPATPIAACNSCRRPLMLRMLLKPSIDYTRTTQLNHTPRNTPMSQLTYTTIVVTKRSRFQIDPTILKRLQDRIPVTLSDAILEQALRECADDPALMTSIITALHHAHPYHTTITLEATS